VAVGAVARKLPDLQWVRELKANPVPRPPELVEGLLHQGCKMVLSGTSKSNKSWCLLDLAMSVASGKPWWGMKCRQAPAVYINFELPQWAVQDRLAALEQARPECDLSGDELAVWNLRGHSADLSALRPKLEEGMRRECFGLVILDPAYKLLGDRDENSNGEIAEMMNQLELVAQSSGAAVVLAHHFAKGEAGSKEAIDRMSGAGAWARDPDALVVLTPHEEEDCFTVKV
jgi:RecA-family ATPase